MKKLNFEQMEVINGGAYWACVGGIFAASAPKIIGWSMVGGKAGIIGGLVVSAAYTALGAYVCR